MNPNDRISALFFKNKYVYIKMVKYVKGGKMIAGKSYKKAADVMLGIPIGTKDGFKYYSTVLGLVSVPDVPDFNKASKQPTDYKSIVEFNFDRNLPKPDPIYKQRKTGEIIEAAPALLEKSKVKFKRMNWQQFLKKYREVHAEELKGKKYKEVQKMASISYKKYKEGKDEKASVESKKKLETLSPDLEAISKKFQKDDTELDKLLASMTSN